MTAWDARESKQKKKKRLEISIKSHKKGQKINIYNKRAMTKKICVTEKKAKQYFIVPTNVL